MSLEKNQLALLGKKSDKVEVVELSKILLPYEWNCRSQADVVRTEAPGGVESNPGFDPVHETAGLGGGDPTKVEIGMIESIKVKGQIEPIDVRPLTDADIKTYGAERCKGKELVAVCGFKRSTALTKIAEEGLKNGNKHPILADPAWDAGRPTVRAFRYETISPLGARIRNFTENTEHDNLAPPDFVATVGDVLALAKQEKVTLTPEDIAAITSKGRSYVYQAISILSLGPKIVNHWRSRGAEETFAGIKCVGTLPIDMMVALAADCKDEPAEKVEREYAKLFQVKRGKRGGSIDAKRLKSVCVQAETLGSFMGWAARRGVDIAKTPGKALALMLIDEEDGFLTFTRSNGKEATEAQIDAITGVLTAAYKDGNKEPDVEEEEEATGKGKANSGKNGKKNGKTAHASAS